MQWHQERQRLLAENVSNADTPQFRPRDLSPPNFAPGRAASTQLSLARSNTAHLTSFAGTTQFQLDVAEDSKRGRPAMP